MNKTRLIQFINNNLWICFLLLLPFTSLPIAAKILHSSMVAAPSILLMVIILVLMLGEKIVTTKKIIVPGAILTFAVFSTLSSLLAFFIIIPVFKEFSILNAELEGLISLFIGLGFYILVSNFITSEEILRKTFRLIGYSMIPLAIWSFIQFLAWNIFHEYPLLIQKVQSFISTSGNLYASRITGFAYEPSWLAHMLNMFYIPIWFGFVVNNASVFKKRFLNISFETLFLLISISLLILSKSRVGLITFFMMLCYFLLLIHEKIVDKLHKKRMQPSERKYTKTLLSFGLSVLYILILIVSIFVLSKFDSRMENLLNPATYQNQNIMSIANEFQFAERIMYWQAGWEIFNDYPVFGVGAGNAGFFFEEKLPSFAWSLDEPRNLFFRASYLPNNKNLWTKLLSESGIFGFGAFVIWLITVWSNALFLKTKANPLFNPIGSIGIFMLIAFIFEGFSIDSFALPYFWILPGIITATANLPNLLPDKLE